MVFIICSRAARTIRPYLFDSSVYAHFWAEDKVGRKGEKNKKLLIFFYLHLIFSDNPRSVGRQTNYLQLICVDISTVLL